MQQQTTAARAPGAPAVLPPPGQGGEGDGDGIGGLYDKVSHILSGPYGGNLHIGLWAEPREDDTLPRAADRMTDLVADHLMLSRGQHLLDVGSGTGAPALRIARRHGVEVTGVSVSAVETDRATALARAEGLAERVRFERADALALPYGAGSFDAACAVESMSHIRDRAGALAQIRRVLRPGGRLVVADGMLLPPQGPRPREARALDAGPAMHLPPTLEGWRTELRESGLTPLEAVDLSDHWRHSAAQMLRLMAEARGEFERAIGAEEFGAALAGLEQFCGHPDLGYVLLVAARN
ncbi:methyltransferase domain-containing protein [Streptomyces sp. NRRL F-5123]|uniref:methyltransferase domain-containing protein n=1 Tax=Streptomyces sp. NRRL F-5123 TaxID=1463856 RepID=UPI000694B374|nr:methyltransferase domain-containing protein [Streptomyces sp. NRRL F-5123]